MSSSLHNRSRTSASSVQDVLGVNNGIPTRSSSKSQSHRIAPDSVAHQPSRPHSAFEQRSISSGHHAGTSNTGTSPPSGTARETFLNYFFGQNGLAPIAGSSVDGATTVRVHAHPRHAAKPITPVGRDVSGGEPVLTSGLMTGKRASENHSAAFDMKSLGKHIEAVSSASLFHVICCFSDLISRLATR